MAFTLTYDRIMESGLTHTYSTRFEHDKQKTRFDYPGLLKLQRMREFQELKSQIILRQAVLKVLADEKKDERGNILTKKGSEEMKIKPQWPAYRYYKSHEIDELIERLSRPTTASQGFERSSELMSLEARRQSSPRFTGTRRRPVSLDRLQTPTHMANIRARRNARDIITYTTRGEKQHKSSEKQKPASKSAGEKKQK